MFDYDPATGALVWKEPIRNHQLKGKAAGSPTWNGYRSVQVRDKLVKVHRLIWCWMTGDWPVGDIDHINSIRSDNRWCNLRSANRQQNNANSRVSKNNKSGFKGVCWSPGMKKWLSQIMKDRKHYTLGYYDDPRDAHAAYLEKAKELFGEFASPG